MSSEVEFEIQQHIMQYLSGSVSLAEFENWFVPMLWDIDDNDEHTRGLAGAVHILISEFSRGDRNEESLREGLTAAIGVPTPEHPR